MSQITRCPSCATTFKVVADQLRISDGWVRCGQCKEVSDAPEHLLRPEPAPLLPEMPLGDPGPPDRHAADAPQPQDKPVMASGGGEEGGDQRRGPRSRLSVGTRLTREEMLHLALMSSENRAAAALLRTYPGGKAAGVAAMNRKARALGMNNTRFVEATGLSGENRSTPADLVRMVKAASQYPAIRDFSTRPELTLQVGRYPTLYRNTNPLVRKPGWDIDITKTGYLSEAGRCLVMKANISGMPVVMVLMNSWGNLTRVADADRVRRWLEAGSSNQPAARR